MNDFCSTFLTNYRVTKHIAPITSPKGKHTTKLASSKTIIPKRKPKPAKILKTFKLLI
jgi:hypothetical protein